MKERISSFRLAFSLIGTLLLHAQAENSKVPAAGPTIKSITPTSTTLTVEWNKLSANDSNGVIVNYTVCYAMATSNNTVSCEKSKTVNGSTNTVTLTGLNENTEYDVAVKAATKNGTGPLGNKTKEKTLEAAPAAGPTIKSISTTSTTMTLMWNELSANDSNGVIVNYTVCYAMATSNDTVSCEKRKTVNGSTNTVTLTGLNENTEYEVAVKASTKIGAGPLGTKMKKKTLEDVPAAGPTIKSVTPTSTTMTVEWNELSANDSNGMIVNYTVCYAMATSNDTVSCEKSKTVNGSTNTVTLTGLNENTEYVVAVKASTKNGTGPLGNKTKEKTLEAVPVKGPTILSIHGTKSTEVTLTWGRLTSNESKGIIISYTVCYAVASSGEPSCAVNETVSGVNTTTTNLTNLNEATTYDVAVLASTSVGAGVLGEKRNITTLEDVPAAGPTIESITPTSTTLTVMWNELSANDSNGVIVNYTVCYAMATSNDTVSCEKNKTVTGGSNTTETLHGLNENTEYDVAVKASTKVGTGPLGEKMKKKTLEAVPAKGPNVTLVYALNSTVLEVAWSKLNKDDSNGNITGYQVCYADDSSTVANCALNKNVTGVDNTKVNLTGLNEATTYYVAIRAGTKVGLGEIGMIKNNKTLEDVPAKGPTISMITAVGSTELKVEWQELTEDDSNGKIVKYLICYREVAEKSGSFCDLNETVDNSGTLMVTLRDLKKFTNYSIAVKAATSIGFGKLGPRRSHVTGEDEPSKPKIREVIPELTRITVKWNKPTEPNGLITKYEVCWDSKGCKNRSSSELKYTIVNLRPGTLYEIRIKAHTSAGAGPEDRTNTATNPSEITNEKPKQVKAGDPKKQVAFELPPLPKSERDVIRFYQVIVKIWKDDDENDDGKTLRDVDPARLKTYQQSNGGNDAYIARTGSGYSDGKVITVGDQVYYDDLSAARRKRRAQKYYNGHLEEGTKYGIFVRVYYSEKTYINSPIIVQKTDTSGLEVAIIILIVILVIVVLLVAVFGALLLRRRKSRPARSDGRELLPTVRVVRNPIAVAEFRSHCDRLGMNAGMGYQDEYENIRPKVSVSAEIAKRPENVEKNRYNNIHAYDDSRVILSEIEGEEGSDYINANYIDGFRREKQFIASQGPVKATVPDFWRMIWEQGVTSMVMVANPVEKGKEKCAVYWPQDKAVKHGLFTIKLNGEVELADYVIRKMTVTKDDEEESRVVTQFHYTVWPDHGVPAYSTSLQAFLTRIRKTVKDDSKPLLVHCSAGVGRTGTFIGIFVMLDRIEGKRDIDIFNYVCQMRGQRTFMVQVESQYVFLHKAVLEAVECGDTEINAADLRVKMNQLNRADPDNTERTCMSKQFQVLNEYTYKKSNTEEGNKPYNVEKNRSKDLLPYEDTRVTILKSPGVDGSDYINASFIDSYQKRGMYIATQFPMENTVNDFWRMVWEKKSNCIVMLAQLKEELESYDKYWTAKSNDAMLCGNFLVTLENEETNDEFIVRNFKIKKTDGGETRSIWHFNFLSWTEKEAPRTTAGIRQMIGKIQEVQRQSGNNPIVVHCSDGGGRTGAFCALVTSLERVKQDSSFNLFQTIMLQRIQRPKMVTTLDQYKFCFKAILDFLDSFDDYANFQDLAK